MKLLFDQNLSPRLAVALADTWTGSVHVRDLGLATASDRDVWARARTDSYAIVTKDTDFRQLSFTEGHPPKVIWIRLGNASTADILDLLRRHVADIEAFGADEQAAYLALG